jgi:hypothetical protein
MNKPRFKPIFYSGLAIPMSPKTRSERFRAWLETWLPVRFGPRTCKYPFGNLLDAPMNPRLGVYHSGGGPYAPTESAIQLAEEEIERETFDNSISRRAARVSAISPAMAVKNKRR